MKEIEIVDIALEALEKNTGIRCKWRVMEKKRVDKKLCLEVDDHQYDVYMEVVKELRNHQIPLMLERTIENKPLIVVAAHLIPKVKEELRALNIGYLEGNGNIYLKLDGLVLWIEGNKPYKQDGVKTNRAFTKTGLKVVFQFLLDQQMVNMPYREIASVTDVGLGNINYVIHGLKEMGYLIEINAREYQLINRRELLDKWITTYTEKLKPTLLLGRFRFLKEEDFMNWKAIMLPHNKTWWGGEPAGDILTNYLKPEELTLYTEQTRSDLIKQMRLIPDENGTVKIYKKFWNYQDVYDNITPPLLVYADLVTTNDRRCLETAKRIYDELIQNKLQ